MEKKMGRYAKCNFNLQASHEACGPTFQTLSKKIS